MLVVFILHNSAQQALVYVLLQDTKIRRRQVGIFELNRQQPIGVPLPHRLLSP